MALAKMGVLSLMLLVVSLYAVADDKSPAVEWTAPACGWIYDGLTNKSDQERVAYPVPPIDRGAQRHRIAIEGKLKNLNGVRQPHTLVVNGNPLPLYTDDDGRFVRPYAFGSGSNSVALISSTGERLQSVQFYDANTEKTPARIRLIMGWDDPGAEVDMHIITPDGQHAFFADPVLSNGGGLDVDGVDGPGPEIFTMAAPLHGTYLVYVNYWGNLTEEGYNFNAQTNRNDMITTQITLVLNENTINEKRENFIVPLRTIGELQLVKTFRY
ncbi:YfaP family protein [Candidatus Methylobacter oryzae]|nr:DUF2135 domain-containing protein [Candidatus Methylobacter oryzae]